MSYFYDFEDDDTFEFEPSSDELENGLKAIIESETSQQIVEQMCELVDTGCQDIEEYFEEELKEYFEPIAYKAWKESIENRKSDEEIWSAYNDQRI